MIKVTRCGYHSVHTQPFSWCLVNGYSDYLLILIKSNAFIEIDGNIIDVPPNTAILYSPDTYIRYGCSMPNYTNDWIHFELQEEDIDFLKSIDIPLNTPFQPTDMTALMDFSRPIVAESFSNHFYKQETLNTLMHTLLYTLASQYKESFLPIVREKYFIELNNLRIAIMNAPNTKWNISELAESVHLSTSHFQYLYKHFFGVSCMQDVINHRLQSVKQSLIRTELSVQTIALRCGYDNERHLLRQFKKYTGLTPSQYRTLHKQ